MVPDPDAQPQNDDAAPFPAHPYHRPCRPVCTLPAGARLTWVEHVRRFFGVYHCLACEMLDKQRD